MSWTSPQDIKDRWIGLTPLPQDTKLTVFIKDVEEQVKSFFPAIQERIDDESLSLDSVKGSVSRIIIEFLLTGGNPYSQVSHSYTGAVSESVSYSSKSRYTLTLTAEDYRLFAPVSSDQAFSLDQAPHLKHGRGVWRTVRRVIL